METDMVKWFYDNLAANHLVVCHVDGLAHLTTCFPCWCHILGIIPGLGFPRGTGLEMRLLSFVNRHFLHPVSGHPAGDSWFKRVFPFYRTFLLSVIIGRSSWFSFSSFWYFQCCHLTECLHLLGQVAASLCHDVGGPGPIVKGCVDENLVVSLCGSSGDGWDEIS